MLCPSQRTSRIMFDRGRSVCTCEPRSAAARTPRRGSTSNVFHPTTPLFLSLSFSFFLFLSLSFSFFLFLMLEQHQLLLKYNRPQRRDRCKLGIRFILDAVSRRAGSRHIPVPPANDYSRGVCSVWLSNVDFGDRISALLSRSGATFCRAAHVCWGMPLVNSVRSLWH